MALALAAAAAALSRVPADPAARLTLRFHVAPPPGAAAALAATLLAVSDPAGAAWGAHLSRDAAEAAVRPPRAATRAVEAWLGASCAAGAAASRDGAWVSAVATAACAEALLGVRVAAWADARGRVAALTLDGAPVLPAAVAAAVALVLPGARPHVAARAPAPAAVGAAAPGTTPATIRAAYGIGDAQASGASKMFVAGFLGEYAEDKDLQQFFATYYPAGAGRTFKKVGPVGPVATGEASLDVQYAMSIGANVTTTFWYTEAGPGPNPYDNVSSTHRACPPRPQL
jgi:tripeptidyl-peptidase-1